VAEVNFVLTDHGEHGIGISSPQLPGLIAGVASLQEATATYLLRLARDVDASIDGFVVHVERLVQFGDQTFIVRCRQDYGTNHRARIAEALVAELHGAPDFRADWPHNALGDVVLVAALGTDRVGDIADAETAGEPVVAVFPYGEDFKAVGIQSPSNEERALTLDAYVRRLLGEDAATGRVREFALA